MATSQQQLAFAIRAVNEASATLKAVQQDIDGIGKSAGGANAPASVFGNTLTNVSQIAGGFIVAKALTDAPRLFMDLAGAAAEDEAAQMRLEQAVKNSGAAYDQYAGQLDAVIEKAQQNAFTDDQARASLSLLVAQTGSTEEAMRRFALAQDLARGAGIDLETASKLLGKVTEENVNVLGRYGINVAKGATETELFGAVQQKFGGQAAQFAASNAAAGERSRIAMAELAESVGYLLLPLMELATGALNGYVIPALQMMIENMDIVGPLLAGAATAITVLVVPAFIAWATAWWALNGAAIVAALPLIALGVAIAAVVAAVIIAIRNWDDISAAIGRFGEAVRDKALGAWDALKTGVRDATNYIIDSINSLLSAWNRLTFSVNIPLVGPIEVGTPDVPLIPRLASGGIVTRPTLALVGEGGEPEAVVPLSRAGGMGFGGGVTVNVYALDARGAADAVMQALVTLERSGRLAPGTTAV